MGSFSLGTGVVARRSFPIRIQTAYSLGRDLFEKYKLEGFQVAFDESRAPAVLHAEISNAEGTRLEAMAELDEQPPVTELVIRLRGQIVVGGMQGLFATENLVRKTAQQRLEAVLDALTADVQPESFEHAPEAAPEQEIIEPEPELENAEPAPPEPVTPEPVAPEPVSPEPETLTRPTWPKGPKSVEQRLMTLQYLWKSGLINDDDYSRKKRELLAEI